MDPTAIVRDGEATVATARKAWRHATSEYLADIDAVMKTIATEIPLTYAIPQPEASGELGLLVGTTPKVASEHYAAVYSAMHVRNWEPFLELRKSWYVFFEGVVSYLDHTTQKDSKGHSIVFFAMTEGEGIEGEMVWNRFPMIGNFRPRLGEDAGREDAASLPLSKVESLALHTKYLAALRSGNVQGVLDLMAERPLGAVRNYVQQAPRFLHLDGRKAMQDHLSAFFERYEVDALEVMSLMANDWYIFSELHWSVRDKTRKGSVLKMHTAEFLPLTHTGRIAARIGYGTPQV